MQPATPTDQTLTRPTATNPSPHSANPFFGQSLEPALLRACEGFLRDIHWFRTDWQRGGALTGYAHWSDGQRNEPVVVKLPIGPRELLWLQRLQVADPAQPIVPRLLAGGREVNGYDLAWVVMQRMPHGPLDAAWNGREFPLFLDAVARFHAAARQYPIEPPQAEPWPDTIASARKVIGQLGNGHTQRWTQALKKVQKKQKKLLKAWNDRPIEDWCHGDLHLANAMTELPSPAGPAVLFDLAQVHAGHWVEDAVYFESLFWARPQRVQGMDLVRMLAAARKEQGLKGDAAWPRLAMIRRILLATAVPVQQVSRPEPVQLDAALAVLEQSIDQW